MKVKTEVLLSAYSGWMMTNEGFGKIKEVFEYLEKSMLTDSSMNIMLDKWNPVLEDRYNLSKHFEKYIMPQEMDLVIESAITELGSEVCL